MSSVSSPAELAEKYGLRASALRPTLAQYLTDLWDRRQFIFTYAKARSYQSYAGARLGSVWQILTPLLNAGVYYFIFGVILGARGNIDNYVTFVVAGMFIFTYTQRAVLEGAKSISSNLSLIRTLHFPRASLPIAYVLNELSQMAITVMILVLVALATGEIPHATWLLIVPALLLQTMFNMGMSLVFARWGAFVSDINQVMPFLLRTWLYVSGVFYSIPDFLGDKPRWLLELLALNPAAAYIDIIRSQMLDEATALPHAWLTAIGWAVGMFVIGFVYFWRAENRYGRG